MFAMLAEAAVERSEGETHGGKEGDQGGRNEGVGQG